MNNIPKKAYFYWGNRILPYLRFMTLKSFRMFNPDWEMYLYVPDTLCSDTPWKTNENKTKYVGENYLSDVSDLDIDIIIVTAQDLNVPDNTPEVIKSDMLRMQLLANTGGLWSDMDILYYKGVDTLDLPENCTDYFCYHPFSGDSKHFHSIGFLMSCGDSQIFKTLAQKAKSKLNRNCYQAIGSILYNQEVNMDETNFGNIPINCVYPCHRGSKIFTMSARIFEYNFLTENTIGIHWYAGHTTSGRHENIMQLSDQYSHDNIISHILKQLEAHGS